MRPTPAPAPAPREAEIASLVEGTCRDPHRFLGVHDDAGRAVVRAWRPGAATATLDGRPMRRIHDAGVFEVLVDVPPGPGYRVTYGGDGGEHTAVEPWGLWPTLGELDVHLVGEGRHERLWTVLGAHPRHHQGVDGTAFAVWAPAARSVRVVGDWNGWDGRAHPMRLLGVSGVWEIFVPEAQPGHRYKYEVLGADGSLRLKADPL
ncbi:MAG: GlgB N-terminal domain-containing protein, partial [Acidimicrobiales bacterium]